ncbi:MFS transporter [Pseudomonas syringae pv. maculicola]|nr:MFS transporter [Pseudomonas syringae pv. maculicola]
MTQLNPAGQPPAEPTRIVKAHIDLMDPAESADYEATRMALLAAMQSGNAAINLEQIRLKPDPASGFGEYCAEKAALPHPVQAENQELPFQIDSDGSVSLALMLRYNYGLSLPQSPDETAIKTLLNTLAELRTSQELGLIDQFDIKAMLTMQNLQDLKRACIEYLGTDGGTLLGKLGAEIIASCPLADVQNSPVTVIARILRSEPARALGQTLLAQLGRPEEETDASLTTLVDRILWYAISSDLHDPENRKPGEIAGYPFTQAENQGRRHADILNDIHNHLITTGKAESVNEAIIACFILALDDCPEWLVSSVPDDLPYGCTEVWVNFQHGVTLAEVIEFGSSRWMSFEDLIELPVIFNKKMDTEEQQVAYVATRMPILLTWAQANGYIRTQSDLPYSEQEIEQAASAFEHSEKQSLEAANALIRKAPERKAMAISAMKEARRTPEIEKILEQEDYWFPPIDLGIRLAVLRKNHTPVYRDHQGTLSPSNLPYDPYGIKHKASSLLEIYMAGENIDDWRLPGRNSNEGLLPINREMQLLYKALPDINQRFENEFQAYLADARKAYATIIRKLLTHLPLKHRMAIENGEVSLHSLRLPTKDVLAATESEKHREPLRGRTGFVIKAVYEGKTTFYEVFPLSMIVRYRPDLEALLKNGVVGIDFWDILPPTRIPVAVYNGITMPFDQGAYLNGQLPEPGASAVMIAETIGERFDSSSAEVGQHQPLTSFSKRSTGIAETITTSLFYVNEDALFAHCKSLTQVEIDNGAPGALEEVSSFLIHLTPWPEIENILSGEKALMRGGAIGLALYMIPYVGPAGKLLAGTAKVVTRLGKSLITSGSKVQVSKLLITAGTTLKDAPLIMIRQAPDMTSKAMTGVSQFVVKHVTWKFLAIRIGIGLSRRLVAIMSRMSRQQAQAAKQEAT